MERMIPPSTSDMLGGTIGDDLDRIEVRVNKLSLNSPDQSLSVLYDLDCVYEKIQSVSLETSKKALNTQLDGILAKLHQEAGLFIRDLGGLHVLVEARDKENPPLEHTWWYLDQFLANRRKAAVRRITINGGIIVLVLVLLATLYQVFLAPDPQVVARYSLEQEARDQLLGGNLEQALKDINAGLENFPSDATLLILKGVVLDGLGRQEEAQQIFSLVQESTQPETFYLSRGHDYLMANQVEKSLADSQAVLKINPQSAQAFLLTGQAYESLKQYDEAIKAYDDAYQAADRAKQYELAAMARTHTAMLMQQLSSQIEPPWALTATPTP
jgi:tetratricopeptide (TPR) repeat protein